MYHALRSAAKANVTFTVPTTTNSSSFITLKAGLVCVGAFDNTTYRFSIPEDISATVVKNGVQHNLEQQIIQLKFIKDLFFQVLSF
jgi:hypothetical protein